MRKVLFVCLGNICRSPAAEGIFRTMVRRAGLHNQISVDSAGTSGYHEGDPADARMIAHARDRGYDLTSLSRPFVSPEDFTDFDLIITMDQSNYRNVLALDPQGQFRHKIKPMVHFCRIHQVDAVPDPYYEGEDGFRLVLDILEDACENLLEQLQKDLANRDSHE